MQAEPTTSGALMARLMVGFEGAGFETQSLLREVGTDAQSVTDPDATIPRWVFREVWRLAARLTADPHLGLHVAACDTDRLLTIADHVAYAAPSVFELLTEHTYIQRVHFHADLVKVSHDREGIELEFDPSTGYCVTPQATEYLVLSVLSLLRTLLLPDLTPSSVAFAHPARGGALEHERVFGCTVAFARSTTRICFPKEQTLRRSPRHSRRTFDLLVRQAERLAANGQAGTMRQQVGDAIQRAPNGDRTVDRMASVIHVSKRTLQRRLREEGASFRQIEDDARRAAALEALAAGADHWEAARRAGFSDPSGFSRAMKRWKGPSWPAAPGRAGASSVSRQSE
jgi:AraC-like DNA-binding protein